MQEKNISLKKRIFVRCLQSSVLILLIFWGYGFYNIYKYRNDFLATNQYVIDYSADQLDEVVSSLENYVDSLYTGSANFNLLSHSDLNDMQVVRAEYYLTNTMQAKADSLSRYGCLFYYNRERDHLRSCYTDSYDGEDLYSLNLELKQLLRKGVSSSTTLVEMGGNTCLLYMIRGSRQLVGYLIDLDRFFDLRDSRLADSQLIICDENDQVVSGVGSSDTNPEDVIAAATKSSFVNGYQYVVVEKALPSCGLTLFLARPYWHFFRFWLDPTFWFLLILIPAAVSLMFVYLYRSVRRLLLAPTDYLLYRLNHLQGKEVDETVVSSGIAEFDQMHRQLDGILEQIETLQYDNYLSSLEAMNVKLQYYTLQANPHFYLNCLTNIDSMIQNGRAAEVSAYIIQLSHHLRYIFKDQSKVVTLREEIKETQAYGNMCTIQSGEPVLLQFQVRDALLDGLVPILSIQTFVANSLQHARVKGRIMKITVTVRTIVDDDQVEKLWIRIADNGTGYPADRLKQLNQPIHTFQFSSYHIGIDNVRYRVRLLYGDRGHITFYNMPQGGAVTELLLPIEIKSNQSPEEG